MHRIVLQILIIFVFFTYQLTIAQTNTSEDNLMVVIRESIGANKQDETLRPTGKGKAKLPDGKEIEIDVLIV